MSVFGYPDPPTTAPRALRRLSHSPVVPTTYLSRNVELEAVEAEAAAAVRRGYDEGYAEGLARAAAVAAGLKQEESQRVAGALSALSQALAAAEESERRMRAEIEAAAPKLAFALLETLLGRELVLAATPGRDAITRVLALDEGLEPATVRLNPARRGDARGARSRPGPQRGRRPFRRVGVGPWSRSGEPSSTGSWDRPWSGCGRSSSVPLNRKQVMTALLDALAEPALAASRPQRYGQVTQMVGMSIEVAGIPAAIGDGLLLLPGGERIAAEVVALRDERVVCLALGETAGLRAGTRVLAMGGPLPVRVGPSSWAGCSTGSVGPWTRGPPSRGSTCRSRGRLRTRCGAAWWPPSFRSGCGCSTVSFRAGRASGSVFSPVPASASRR